MSMENTRETVQDEYDNNWKYLLFDHFMMMVDSGERTMEQAMNMYTHVVDVTERLGTTAVGHFDE